MKEAGMASISIFDLNGKLLNMYRDLYEAGKHTITIDKKELPASGVMYYQLQTGTFSATKKMLLVR